MYCSKISIENIEEFAILTDDIVDILRYKKAFFDDEGNQRYFENARAYRDEMMREENFIVESFLYNLNRSRD